MIIRADASSVTGTGHVMRTMALALAAQTCSIDAYMMCRIGVDWLAQRLTKGAVPHIALNGEVPAQEDPEGLLRDLKTTSFLPKQTWVVLDGYYFGLDCQKAVRKAGYKTLIIDDYCHLPEYSCDILLNQNIGAEEFAYHGDIGKKLLGLDYVLLRPEFAAAREKALQRVLPKSPHNLLLTLGGGDFSTYLHDIASCLSIPEMQGRTLRVIAGAMPEKRIRYYLQNCPAHIEILSAVDDMPTLLLDTDLCITAGGSTCWELCCMGIPFLAVEVAENQRKIVQFLVSNKISKIANADNLALYLTQQTVFPQNELVNLCKGNGAQNVVEAMFA